jgi:hypothetical protein
MTGAQFVRRSEIWPVVRAPHGGACENRRPLLMVQNWSYENSMLSLRRPVE